MARRRDDGEGRDVGDLPPAPPRARSGPAPHTYRGLVSIAEYRKLLGDQASTDAAIAARLEYLEALFRSLIRAKLETLFRTDL